MVKLGLTARSVVGRVRVQAENLDKVSQWGGTEATLSWESGTGPCLVVRSSKHKKTQGTLFHLKGLQKVFSDHVDQGRLTLVLPHLKRVCTVYITTETHQEELKDMTLVLATPTQWRKEMEHNVLQPNKRKREAYAGDDGEGERSDSDGERVANPVDDDAIPRAGPATTNADAVQRRASSFLTSEQLRAVALVKQGSNVFVTGCAGTGKTQLLNHLVNMLPKDTTAVTAPTAQAARMVHGQTIHSFAGIGRGEGTIKELAQKALSRPAIVKSIAACRVWIVEEISMVSASLFSTIDAVARAAKKRPSEPFGGIQVVVFGDFFQLPPIVRGADADASIPVFAFESRSFLQLAFKVVELSKVFRQKDDELFQRCLADLRLGVIGDTTRNALKSCVNRSAPSMSLGIAPTRLFALQTDVDRINAECLNALPGHTMPYAPIDACDDPGFDMDSGATPLANHLSLKEGAQVVMVINVDTDRGLVNGARGIVRGFDAGTGWPIVQFVDGQECVVEPYAHSLEQNGRVVATRKQIPLRLAWALTIHRCQGMTLDSAEIGLDGTMFEFGQAYVALSRCRGLNSLRLSSFDERAIKAHPKVLQYYGKEPQPPMLEAAQSR